MSKQVVRALLHRGVPSSPFVHYYALDVGSRHAVTPVTVQALALLTELAEAGTPRLLRWRAGYFKRQHRLAADALRMGPEGDVQGAGSRQSGIGVVADLAKRLAEAEEAPL